MRWFLFWMNTSFVLSQAHLSTDVVRDPNEKLLNIGQKNEQIQKQQNSVQGELKPMLEQKAALMGIESMANPELMEAVLARFSS